MFKTIRELLANKQLIGKFLAVAPLLKDAVAFAHAKQYDKVLATVAEILIAVGEAELGNALKASVPLITLILSKFPSLTTPVNPVNQIGVVQNDLFGLISDLEALATQP